MARVPPVLISPPQYSALTSQMETRRTTRPTMQRFDLSVSVDCVCEFVLSIQHTVLHTEPTSWKDTFLYIRNEHESQK